MRRILSRYRRISVIIGLLITLYSTYCLCPYAWNKVLIKMKLKSVDIMPTWTVLKDVLLKDLVDPDFDTVLIRPKFANLPSSLTDLHESGTPFAIIFIMSVPTQDARVKRNAIRSTWYKWKDELNFIIVFFIGVRKPGVNSTLSLMHEEAQKYGDIILDSHVEKYYLLLPKILRAMKFYLSLYRDTDQRNLPYFIKTDDDVFINLPNLYSAIKSIHDFRNSLNAGNFLAGHLFSDPLVDRYPWSKFYVPTAFWEKDNFPNYLGGSLYILSRTLVQDIYKVGLQSRYFPFEDVFLTGVAPSQLFNHFNHTDFKHIYNDGEGSFRTLVSSNEKMAKFISVSDAKEPYSMRYFFNRVKIV